MNDPNRFYVYAYYDESPAPFYIGKGSGARDTDHLLAKNRKRKTRFYRKLQGMLKEGREPRVVRLRENLTENEAYREEVELVAKFGRLDLGTGSLCNHTSGGDGISDISEETRKRMSAAKKGRVVSEAARESYRRSPRVAKNIARLADAKRGVPLSPRHREKVRAAGVGRTHSPETRARISSANIGKHSGPVSPETRAKISASHRGRPLSEYHRKRIQESSQINPVRSYNPETGAVRIYASVADAAREGFCQPSISKCCAGKLKKHKGLQWSFAAIDPASSS